MMGKSMSYIQALDGAVSELRARLAAVEAERDAARRSAAAWKRAAKKWYELGIHAAIRCEALDAMTDELIDQRDALRAALAALCDAFDNYNDFPHGGTWAKLVETADKARAALRSPEGSKGAGEETTE